MADPKQRTAKNVPGKFYVDNQCLTHAMCQHLAPKNFAYDEENRCYYVCKQPATPQEVASVWRRLRLVQWRRSELTDEHDAEQNHWSERGRAMSVGNSDELGRPHC